MATDANAPGTPAVDFHQMWRAVRAQGPVVPGPPSDYYPGPTALVVGFEEASQVLRDGQTYSSSIHTRQDDFRGVTIRQMDGPEHRRHRALLAHAFRPSAVERWEREAVRPVIDALLDAVAPHGRAELVSEVTSAFPIQVICTVLGIPPAEHARFLAWSEQIVRGAMDPQAGLAAKDDLGEFLAPHVEARRADPRDDLLSDLVGAEVDGERLDDDHLYGFLRLLIPAGAETTYRALGTVLLALLTHPEALASARVRPETIPMIVEETLRWDTSIPMTVRTAAEDTVLAGCPVAAGTTVQVIVAAADRDGTRWDEPDRWDPDRAPQPSLAFGLGPHQCLGIHLARTELHVGVRAVLERLPNLRLDPAEPVPNVEGMAFRGPTRLPVLFDPV